jgi:hypothetical protein
MRKPNKPIKSAVTSKGIRLKVMPDPSPSFFQRRSQSALSPIVNGGRLRKRRRAGKPEKIRTSMKKLLTLRIKKDFKLNRALPILIYSMKFILTLLLNVYSFRFGTQV